MIPKELILNTRLWAIAAGAMVAAILVLAVAGQALGSRLELDPAAYRRVHILAKIVFTLLGLGLGFCIPPLLVRAFLFLQVEIGNSEVPVVAFILRNEANVILLFWLVFLLGLLIASPYLVRALLLGEG